MRFIVATVAIVVLTRNMNCPLSFTPSPSARNWTNGVNFNAPYLRHRAHIAAYQVIYAVRVDNKVLEPHQIDDLVARMRERLEQRGELSAEVVVVQGRAKETLRLFGAPYSVERVRNAMFNAAITWMPLDLGSVDWL